MGERADRIFRSGVVITVDSDDTVCEAVAVKGNRILAAGTDEEIMAMAGEGCEITDLHGRALVPGFIDSHIHYNVIGMTSGPLIDVSYEAAPSIEDIKAKIAEDVRHKKPGEWVSMLGYDHTRLREHRHPTAADFDEVAPDNPVCCLRVCAHMAVFNTRALELGGEELMKFDHDQMKWKEDGTLEGLLQNNAMLYLHDKVQYSESDIRKALRVSDAIVHQYGITSVHDAGSNAKAESVYKLMEQGTRSGELKTRIYAMIFDAGGKEANRDLLKRYTNTGITTGFGNDHYRVGPAKIMIDGSSTGPTAAMKEPYTSDPDGKPVIMWEQEEIDDVVSFSNEAEYQCTCHAIGDGAVQMMLDAYSRVLPGSDRKDCRHRIEHAGFVDRGEMDQIKEMGIVPVANPGFIELSGKEYNRYYGDRVDYMFPCRSYRDRGIIAAMGSDCPVINPNPMLGIWASIAREDGETGEPCGKCQSIGIMDAIRMYTINGAYASFEEDIKGSLEPGKLADMAVLSENILTCPVENIRDIKVDMTVIDGETVYERKVV